MISIDMSMKRRKAHEDLLDGMGICQLSAHRPTAQRPSLWETIRLHEPREVAEERQQLAKLECNRCPLLRPCEEMLSDLEKNSQPVDGITAGRWPDCVTGPPRPGASRQDKCRACTKPMKPQRSAYRTDGRIRSSRVARLHVGEGLCDRCYPEFSRWGSHEKRL